MTNNLQKFIILSLIVHLILVSILSIKWYTNIRQSTKAIDVTITKQTTHTAPDKADYLAQKNNLGGGLEQIKHKPKTSSPAKFHSQKVEDTTEEQEQKIILKDIDKLPHKQENALATKNYNSEKNKININLNNSESETESNFEFIIQQQTSPQLTSLINDIQQRAELYAKRAKTRFISASTQEYRDAEYLEKWRKKIEYYGNKYYPEQARTRDLAGRVIMLVSIRSNGDIASVKIENSSGIKILDDAAVQAVHLAAPFEPFTAQMKKDTDILEIVRTWSFNEDGSRNVTVAQNNMPNNINSIKESLS